MSGKAGTTDEPRFDRTKSDSSTGEGETSPPKNKVPQSSTRTSSASSSGGSSSSDKCSAPGPGEFFNRDRRSKSKSPLNDIKDKFFQDFYERRKNRPRLSERLFNRKDRPSLFNEGGFIDDLRKELDKDKMFWGDGVDPFGSHFQRGSSPGPQTNGSSAAGSGSPRMGRAGAGFPFESSRFDEFGRHPMFSTMRRQPPWEVDDPFGNVGGPFHRERNNSGSSGCASGSSTASAGEHEHIIPIRIERSDGTTTTAGGAKAKAAAAAAAQNGHHNPISTTPIPMPAPEGMTPVVSPSSSQAKPQQYLGPQRSSTEEVRKSPVPGDRFPRAQSAPPDSLAADKKFVSSINIESNSTKAPQQPSGPQVTQFGGNCTKEKTPPKGSRQIPIFVDNQNQGRPFPQPPREGPPPQDLPQYQQQQKSSRPAERESTPPPKKPAPPKDPLEKVADISNDVKDLEEKISEFEATSRNKEYLFLDEMLTRNLIKLDVIETEGREDVRLARKDCIKLIQNCISKLEAKVPLPTCDGVTKDENDQNMEVDAEGANPTDGSGDAPTANDVKISQSSNVPAENTHAETRVSGNSGESGDAVVVSA